MKSDNFLHHFFFKVLLLFPALSVCTGIICEPRISLASSQNSVMRVIEQAQSPYKDSSVESAFPIFEETVLSRERYQGGTFRVLARKGKLDRSPCSACHTDTEVKAQDSARLTHGDIVLNHGQSGALSCLDCHSREQKNLLEDREGNAIDLDHSYQLCGQCHFRQKSDWLGGAHGKRVSNWNGERVIFNCTTCHDPHSPRFEKRFPATYSPSQP
ncbi:hypothetical protein [Desulfopila inferna]|uniref:hypothetical protein n=1 Tax=Desulfopila inferna TaxID=468528 RepID=UPI001965C0D5|nr:hypothetical protein [Desulfopila inferna]MBM9603489.1 hypothetical protein [Desulfopila inferna]